MLEKITKRDDNWGRQVQIKISGFNDLIAPEAKYHRKCHSNFFMMKQNPVSKNLVTSPKGRPINERLFFLFSRLCSYIESQDECQYTIEELEKLMKEMNDDEDLSFTRITLKNKLKGHYGEQMIVTSTAGLLDIVSFKGFAHELLREQWRRDQRDPWTDKEVLIDMTATQISDEIRTMCVDKTSYPPFNSDEVDKLVPSLLLRLLQGLVSSKSKDQQQECDHLFIDCYLQSHHIYIS